MYGQTVFYEKGNKSLLHYFAVWPEVLTVGGGKIYRKFFDKFKNFTRNRITASYHQNLRFYSKMMHKRPFCLSIENNSLIHPLLWDSQFSHYERKDLSIFSIFFAIFDSTAVPRRPLDIFNFFRNFRLDGCSP